MAASRPDCAPAAARSTGRERTRGRYPLREAARRLAVAHHRHGHVQPEYHGERYAREMQGWLFAALAETEAAATAHFGSNAWL